MDYGGFENSGGWGYGGLDTSAFNDYYNQLYPDQVSRAYNAQQLGGRTMFTNPPQTGGGQPQRQMPQGSKNYKPTTPFGQYENLSQTFQPGSAPRMMNLQGGGVRSSDQDYMRFLTFLSMVGPLIFGDMR